MRSRWIIVAVFSFALPSCSQRGIDGPTREFSGVWLYEFEGSTFIEGAHGVPAEPPRYEEADWLEWADQPELEAVVERSGSDGACQPVQPIRLRFIGYRTRYPTMRGAGHLGLWGSQVTVSKTISSEALGPAFCYDQ